jgi:hypothetical protein
MSLQVEKQQLENEFSILSQQASQTSEAWNDPVQRRFYDQFINNMPKEFAHFINELHKLDTSFENAERVIASL